MEHKSRVIHPITEAEAARRFQPFTLATQWLQDNRALFMNAGSLVATTAVTSALGFAYWWLAARLFPPDAVGLASAAVSAMMLLGAIGVLGLGTLLIGELPRQPGRQGAIIMASLLVAGIASGVLAVLFALAAPLLSPELTPFSSSAGNIFFFAAGVVFTAVTIVIDQALIGLLRGGLQLGRNTLFAVAKLGILYLVSLWASREAGLNIYVAWMLGNLLSLVTLAGYLWLRGIRVIHRPQWDLIRTLRRAALAHHAVNLVLQAPSLLMPLAVTTLLSASANASFYAAWMVVSFAFVIPSHLATVLYAVGAGDPSALVNKLRMTMRLSLMLGVPVAGGLFLVADPLLNLFGAHYAEQADWCLRLLSIGIFPLIIKYHYVALLRVYGKLEGAMLLLLGGSLLEMVLVVIGLELGALTGLSIGWLVAVSVEAVWMYFKIHQTITQPLPTETAAVAA